MLAGRHTPVLTAVPAPALRRVLAEERDPHRRQRELVRASLIACPGKARPRRPLMH